MPLPTKSTIISKLTRNHTTLTETSSEVVEFASKLEEVTKISLGAIKHVPGGRRDLKFHPIIGGIKAIVRGNGSVHELYIYTKEPAKIQQVLGDQFRK